MQITTLTEDHRSGEMRGGGEIEKADASERDGDGDGEGGIGAITVQIPHGREK